MPLLNNPSLNDFLKGKSAHTVQLLEHFLEEFEKIGTISLHPTKTMIGVVHSARKIAWITQLGKNFVHIVFPFSKEYKENFCFQKIAQVPGAALQFNHHFRMLSTEDLNQELLHFMQLAFEGEKKDA